MGAFPDVFVKILALSDAGYSMERGYNVASELEIDALYTSMDTLRHNLWPCRSHRWQQPERFQAATLIERLIHTNLVYSGRFDQLVGRVPSDRWVRDLVYSVFAVGMGVKAQQQCIHGDPTASNLVATSRGLRWIDPIWRDYIPGDPHVDLGKAYQSILGYENVLRGAERLATFEEKAADIYRMASVLDLEPALGMRWCMIHMLRLLPYQTDRDRDIFIRWFTEDPRIP